MIHGSRLWVSMKLYSKPVSTRTTCILDIQQTTYDSRETSSRLVLVAVTESLWRREKTFDENDSAPPPVVIPRAACHD